jgi:hypothetical protein
MLPTWLLLQDHYLANMYTHNPQMQMHTSLQDQYANLSLAIHIVYTTSARWNVITTPALNYYFPIIFTQQHMGPCIQISTFLTVDISHIFLESGHGRLLQTKHGLNQ